jgi:hypothetical protein
MLSRFIRNDFDLSHGAIADASDAFKLRHPPPIKTKGRQQTKLTNMYEYNPSPEKAKHNSSYSLLPKDNKTKD